MMPRVVSARPRTQSETGKQCRACKKIPEVIPEMYGDLSELSDVDKPRFTVRRTTACSATLEI